jgi:zinc protease
LQPAQSFNFMNAYPVRHFRLENGLEAYLVHNPISPVVAFLTHYTVGSAAEGENERGLAHFFEHMMFRETERLRDGDFDRIVAEAGGVGLNAFTSYDTTAYHVNLPAAQLERVVTLEADRMVNLRLSPELIEAERGAVLGEIAMYQDMPSEQLWNTLMREAFPTHPYRHPIVGYREQVQAFTDEDFARFYRAHYAPNRAVVVVAGGFDEPAVRDLIARSYGGLAPGAARPPSAAPDGPWEESRRVELRHEKVSSETLMMAWRSPGLIHPRLPALLLLGAVLSGGQSSPLHRRIVLKGLGTHASAFTLESSMMLVSPGLVLLDVALQHGVPAERAEEEVLALLEALAREGIAGEELERALNQVRLHWHASLGTNMSLARQLGGYAVATGDPLFGQRLLARLEQVSAQEVQEALRDYLTTAPRLTVIQRPGEPETP